MAKNDQLFCNIWTEAYELGLEAGQNCTPNPMIVDDGVRQYFIEDGSCGFAWVHVAPATSAFARWLIKQKYAHAAYYGGIDIWIHVHGQSYARKLAHAEAMAKAFKRLLSANDISYKYVYADGRLD